MNPLEATLRCIVADVSESGRPWALVGGLAVSARAEPRTTRDVDIAVATPDDAEAEAFLRDLQARGYRVVVITEQTRVNRLATARLRPPGESTQGAVVDLLFASSGIEREVAEEADIIEILPGLMVPIACIGHLLALKVLARDDRHRPQDFDDIQVLLAEARPDDLARARSSLTLIEQRGYERSRRLVEAFDGIVDELSP